MNEAAKKLYFNLFRAWRRLFGQIPESWLKTASGGASDDALTLAAFPLLGAATGYAILLVFAVLSAVFSRPVSAVFFGLFAAGFLLWKDRGQSMMTLGREVFSGRTISGFFSGAEPDEDRPASGAVYAFATLISAVEFFVFWSLFRNAEGGLAAAFFLLYFSLQGLFAMQGGLEVSGEHRILIAALAGMLLLTTLLGAPFGTVLFMLLAASAVGAAAAGTRIASPMTENVYWFFSGAAQLALLLVLFVSVLA